MKQEDRIIPDQQTAEQRGNADRSDAIFIFYNFRFFIFFIFEILTNRNYTGRIRQSGVKSPFSRSSVITIPKINILGIVVRVSRLLPFSVFCPYHFFIRRLLSYNIKNI